VLAIGVCSPLSPSRDSGGSFSLRMVSAAPARLTEKRSAARAVPPRGAAGL
jgi:hypothetical protein